MDKTELTNALVLLSEHLEANGNPETHLVVCGGSSLIITGMVERKTTKDVDVLGILENGAEGVPCIASAKPLPEWLSRASQQVTNAMDLGPGWLNAGPADLNKWGLPSGLVQRLSPRRFGNVLVVHFISRLDQICFKTYAAADSGPGRHFDDLLALEPTETEMEMGAKWTRTQDPSEGFRGMIQKMLEVMGFGNIAQQI